jgi:hypothetical protein
MLSVETSVAAIPTDAKSMLSSDYEIFQRGLIIL